MDEKINRQISGPQIYKVEVIGDLKIVSLEWGGVDKSPISGDWKESGQQCTTVVERENS